MLCERPAPPAFALSNAGFGGCSLLVRLAPVVTVRELQEPESARRQMFQEGSFVSLTRNETPGVVDHDKGNVVGRVLEFSADDAQGGRWTVGALRDHGG